MKNIVMALLAGLLSAGYVQASDQKNIADVKALVQNQTGYSSVMNADIQKEIEVLLAQPLTQEAAAKVTFLNNPLIKAELASIGISEADMREAGILHNPILTYSSRSSKEEGAKRNNEIEIKQDVMDVLFWPLRKKVAGTQFKVAQYQAAQKIAGLVKASQLSYLEWLAAVHKRKLAEDHFTAQQAALEITTRQKEAGNINALQMAGVQAITYKAKVEWLKTEAEVEKAAQYLRTALGLKPDQFFMEEVKQMPELPNESLVLATLEKQMLERRLDLSMKSLEIKSLEQSINLAAAGILPEIEVGYDQETEADGNKLKGIVVEGQVPVFNRNQAKRIGIKAAIETAKHQLEGMEQQALLDVRLAYQNLLTSRKIVDTYKEAMPVYQQMVKETLYEYNFMLKDVFHVLESKQAELENQEEYVDALKGYWSSRIELEYAMGQKLPFDLPVSSGVAQPIQPLMIEHKHGG